MQKDYLVSTKYTQDQLTALDIPYKYRDYCQDDYGDYLTCVRSHPRALGNKLIYQLPFSQYYSYCKVLFHQWEKCQQYRQNQLLTKIKKIVDKQRQMN